MHHNVNITSNFQLQVDLILKTCSQRGYILWNFSGIRDYSVNILSSIGIQQVRDGNGKDRDQFGTGIYEKFRYISANNVNIIIIIFIMPCP